MKILVVSYKKPSETVLSKLFLNNLSKKIQVLFVTYESKVSIKYETTKLKKINNNIRFFSAKNLSNLDLIIKKENPQLILSHFAENLTNKFEKLYIYLKQTNVTSVRIVDQPFIWNRNFKKLTNKITKKKYIYDHGILCSKASEYSHKYHAFKNKHLFCNKNYILHSNEKIKNPKNKKINLFVDENFVNHPDIKINNLKNFPTSEKYHNQLISFFDFLKKEFKKKIYIAAHPSTLKNNYKKNRIIFNNTLKFVKIADLIILHQSSAIDYAILSKKDLLFITTDKINKSQPGVTIKKISKFFNNKPLNLSINYDSKLIKKRIVRYKDNINVYNKFINEFIKHPKFKQSIKIEKIYNRIVNEKTK